MIWTAVIAGSFAVLGAIVGAAIARGTVLRQIRYTKVQEKRAEVIPELYSKFLDIHFRLNMTLRVEDGLVSSEMLAQDREPPSYFAPNPLTRGTAVEEKINELDHYFYLNRLWLGKNVDEKAKTALDNLEGNSHRYFLGLVRTTSNDARREEHLAEMRNWITSEIPTALQALETESRKALGTKKDRGN